MLQEQLGDSCRVQGGDCGDGVNPLGQAIHHHEDGIVSLGVQEFSNHVYGDHLPASVRDFVGDQLPHLLHREGLCPVACIAPCDELGNIHTWTVLATSSSTTPVLTSSIIWGVLRLWLHGVHAPGRDRAEGC